MVGYGMVTTLWYGRPKGRVQHGPPHLDKIINVDCSEKNAAVVNKSAQDVLKSGKRRRAGTGRHCDYLDNKMYKVLLLTTSS